MDVRLKIAVASQGVNVAEFCRQVGISRESFYVWRRRFQADGLAGLEPLSRRPRSNPRQTAPAVEDQIVVLRKELDELGVDAGAATIQWHFAGRWPHCRVPSQATIWRVLTRRGFITPQPRKRPKASLHRFQADVPNELWQADCIWWTIATGQVSVLSFLDDCTRVALRVRALSEATTDATWDTFCQASERWGIPLGQLSDNGLNFSGKLRGFEVRFETELRAIGVVPKTSRPYHPQTCGKVERFQQTLKKWLRRRPLAADLAELQAQLDDFVAYYNHHRPHRAHHGQTPADRWAATPPAINLGIALPSPARHANSTADANGVIAFHPWRINIGKHWAGHTVDIHADDTHIAVFHHHQLVRALQIDKTRRYQPLTPRH